MPVGRAALGCGFLLALGFLDLVGTIDEKCFVSVAGEGIDRHAARIALVDMVEHLQVLLEIQLFVKQQFQLFKVTHNAPGRYECDVPIAKQTTNVPTRQPSYRLNGAGRFIYILSMPELTVKTCSIGNNGYGATPLTRRQEFQYTE